ncbi:MAG: isoprenyl transferase [Clostridiales bacterium]|nr:isoprenyl transferase [Clostridiales bacterium]
MPKAEYSLPRHVAIIMDGNGRWAKQHRLAIALGHRKGVETLREIVRYSSDAGIEVLSLYAFSTENWKRSQTEVAALMTLILEFFRTEIDELDEKEVSIRILGNIDALPAAQHQAVNAAQMRTADNKGLQLNIALNYGSRDEILQATIALAHQVASGHIRPDEISSEMFENELYTKGQPDVDLLIRTSGELRLSNFLLYQNAYAEMMFPQPLWPDFTVDLYKSALKSFQQRERRYGGRTT